MYDRLRGLALIVQKLARDGRGVEVDPLAHEPVVLEEEQRDAATLERTPSRRDPAQLAPMRAEQHELGDHRVVGVVQRDQLVALVGERGARLGEVPRDLVGAVVHVAGRHDLVARVVEGREGHVELVPVLGLHVLAHGALAGVAEAHRAATGVFSSSAASASAGSKLTPVVKNATSSCTAATLMPRSLHQRALSRDEIPASLPGMDAAGRICRSEAYKPCPRPDVLVAARAAQEWSVLSLDELRACGLSRDGVAARVRNGRLHPMYRGIYAVGHANPPLEGHFLAAVKTCGPHAVLSHFSAAAHWGFWDWDDRYPELTVPRTSSPRHPGLVIHRSLNLTARDITRHKGIRVTSPARTALDLAPRLSDRPLRRLVRPRGP